MKKSLLCLIILFSIPITLKAKTIYISLPIPTRDQIEQAAQKSDYDGNVLEKPVGDWNINLIFVTDILNDWETNNQDKELVTWNIAYYHGYMDTQIMGIWITYREVKKKK